MKECSELFNKFFVTSLGRVVGLFFFYKKKKNNKKKQNIFSLDSTAFSIREAHMENSKLQFLSWTQSELFNFFSLTKLRASDLKWWCVVHLKLLW